MTIIASCGHILTDQEGCGISVAYKDEYCDAEEGFKPCTVHAIFCNKCEREWRDKGLLFKDEAEASEWLSSQRI